MPIFRARRLGSTDEIDPTLNVLDLLDQDEVWIGSSRTVHLIVQIPRPNCLTIMAWLEQHSDDLTAQAAVRLFGQSCHFSPVGRADMTRDFCNELDRMTDPLTWIRQTRLFVALAAQASRTDGPSWP